MSNLWKLAKIGVVVGALGLSGCLGDDGNKENKENKKVKKIETNVTSSNIEKILTCASKDPSKWKTEMFDNYEVTWTNEGISIRLLKRFDDKELLIRKDTDNNINLRISTSYLEDNSGTIQDHNGDGTLSYGNNKTFLDDTWSITSDRGSLEAQEIHRRIKKLYEETIKKATTEICGDNGANSNLK